ncbi:uncharacterized protein [Nerophis lumbriciformis]|uniref:uncharacterized protein n=1 Tax=Nerophis lumbriciformis TaxID=546530 RepID=UPI002ADFD82C|nr:uncharacterized protein LOC133574983 [Nerophis lumbriciformis]
MLKELVKERLLAAADEIFALFESTIASYEEELSRTREKGRRRQHLEVDCETPTVLHFEDIQGSATIKQVDPQPPCIKEEAKELWITPEEECLRGQREADLTKLPLTVVSVKTEDGEDESSRLRHSPSEENIVVWEPPSRTTKADGGSQADDLIAPLSDSDDMTSHSAEDEDSDDNQETLSRDTDCEGDDKHSERFKRRTGKPRWTHAAI